MILTVSEALEKFATLIFDQLKQKRTALFLSHVCSKSIYALTRNSCRAMAKRKKSIELFFQLLSLVLFISVRIRAKCTASNITYHLAFLNFLLSLVLRLLSFSL